MPGQHARAALGEIKSAGWRVRYANAHAKVYAFAYCPGGGECCPPFSINGTPRVDEHEAEKIRKKKRQHDAKVAAQLEAEKSKEGA
jgi:hypothetical protein